VTGAGDAEGTLSPRTRTIIEFLDGIGIPVQLGTVTGPTAVPGITIDAGGLVLDPTADHHDGDLLHEAGHLALLPPSVRATASGMLDAEFGAGYEVGAICWSVAAAGHLGLALEDVFHADGYRGASDWLTETYGAGTSPGLPLLQWAGLAWEPGRAPAGAEAFPHMRQWVRTTEIQPADPSELT
jgi:hypothetical protein